MFVSSSRPSRKFANTRLCHAKFCAVVAIALLAASLTPTSAAPPDVGMPMRNGVPSLAPIVENVMPAVVNISVTSKAKMPEIVGIPREFRRFFQLPGDDGLRDDPPQRTQTSLGSGVIIDGAKGYVITNHHVIDKATEVTVTLKDRREFTAKVIGSDEGTDIALLQIKADNHSELPLGDSTKLMVGDFVIAVGNPFGLGQSVTYGIVSALGRSALNIEGYEDFIQMDAAINRGNSGGALVTLKGELVGINSAIIGPAGGNVGIGFAVPTAMASAVVNQLLKYGEVKRGLIGVEIGDMSPAIAKNLGINVSEGALVRRVIKGSPAEAASVEAGDIITHLNGRHLRGSADLRNRLGLMPVGTTVELTYNRDGKTRKAKVTIGKTPKEASARISEHEALQGASFENTDEDAKTKGVLVSNVRRGSVPWQLGLRTNDVIVAVNRKRVKNLDDFLDAMKDSASSTVLALKRGEEDVRIVLP